MIDSTLSRLLAIADSPLDKVEMVLELATATDHEPARPVECYVIPVSERPINTPRTTGLARQEVAVTVGILLGIRSLNDTTGSRSRDRLKPVRDAVRNALYGWTPEGATTHYMLAGSDLVRVLPGGIWWIDRYTTKTQRQQRG